MSETYYSDNYIDIFTISDYQLAVFPLFLIFGPPTFDTRLQKVKFNCETSFKLPEDSISYWFTSLQKLIDLFFDNHTRYPQELIYSETPVQEEERNNLENKKDCFYFQVSNTILTITSTYTAKPVHFTFDASTFVKFCEGFSTIFFKLYCYTPAQNLCIEQLVKSENTGFLIESSFHEIFLSLRAQALMPLTINECVRISELIIRHKDILIKWKKFALMF
jgi:hypothetical protein